MVTHHHHYGFEEITKKLSLVDENLLGHLIQLFVKNLRKFVNRVSNNREIVVRFYAFPRSIITPPIHCNNRYVFPRGVLVLFQKK